MTHSTSNIWLDPFEKQSHPIWQQTRPLWTISPSKGWIHRDETFGKLELYQKNPDVFEVTYQHWQVQLLADSCQMEVLQSAGNDVPAFYMFERIALPILRLIRGCLLIHASCVEIYGKCLVLLAQTGVGKTSLAGALLNQPDARLVAEDTLAVTHGLGFDALPSADYLAVRHHLLDDMNGVDSVEDMEIKRILHLNSQKCRKEPLTVNALMVLSKGENEPPVRIQNRQEILPLILRQQMAFSNAPTAFKRMQFQAMMDLIRQVPVYRMGIDLSCADRMRECTEKLLQWRMWNAE